MDLKIGDRVKIIKRSGMTDCLLGEEFTVCGFEHNPPREISLIHLEHDRDILFKYPRAFRWELENLPIDTD